MDHRIIRDLPEKELVEGVSLRSVHLDNVMVTFVELEEGSMVPPHSHPHEQISLVISGSLLFNVAGETKVVKAGEAVLIPSNVEHSVSVVDGPALAYDCWSPIREDYIIEE